MNTSGVRGGSVVLDSEGLSRAVRRDLYLQMIVEDAIDNRVSVVVSAATIVEIANPKLERAALNWVLSRFRVEPVTKKISLAAADLLVGIGRSGHTLAIDAIVAATALSEPGHSTIFTSDPTDLIRLVGNKATVVPLS